MASNESSAAQTRRPLWKHVVFWGSAIPVGFLLAATHAPFWAGLVAVAVMCCALLPWYMLSGGRRG